MKCQRCKEREANVQIMQQIAGKKPQTFMLCDVCAREMGISLPTFPMTGKMSSNPFSAMGNMFQSNFGLGAGELNEKLSYRCSQCNMTFEDFKKTGFLGCSHCYEAFASQMDPVFCRTQMGKKHVGRKLGSKSIKGSAGEKSSNDSCEIDLTKAADAQSGEENAKSTRMKSSAAIPSAEKPGKKRKLPTRESPPTTLDEESEELMGLERQHMNRLIEEKRAELSAAVSAEDYLSAAKIRDEITALNKKKEG